MAHTWHDIPGEHLPQEFHSLIEMPLGPSVKHEIDKASGLIKMDGVWYSAVYDPANYGFIPQTLAEDDDPLDVPGPLPTKRFAIDPNAGTPHRPDDHTRCRIKRFAGEINRLMAS